ncbi:MAG: outer membrane beta-barrel protein [Ferruginibacter sp.]
MKRLIILLAVVFYCMNASAQTGTDTTVKSKHSDTLRIGNIIIIKKGGKRSNGKDSAATVVTAPKKKSRITTNWGGVDIGFSNYSDKTNYVAATADGFLRNGPSPDIDKNDFKLRTGKSININIWIVTQQLNLVKENVSLRYGLGLELNNYRYKSSISYKEDGTVPYTNGTLTNKPFIFRDSISFSKNKLAADYLTIPVMLNFSTNKWGNNKNNRGFNIAFGVSGGFLYSQRNKQRSELRGKEKNKGDYDLEKFKFSYLGEIGFGAIKLYASYSPKSIYEHSLDMRPYNFGFRINAL